MDVRVISPTGQTGTADSSRVQDLIKRGFRLETAEESKDRELKQHYGESFKNKVLAGALGALRGATFGLSDLAIARTPEQKENVRNLKEYNPFESGLGQVTGVLGSLALPGGALVGGVSKLTGAAGKVGASFLQKEAAKQIVGRVVGETLQGSIYGAGEVISEAALGDPTMTAQKIFNHITLGAILGGGFGAVAGSLSAFNAPKSLARQISKSAEAMAQKATGATRVQAEKFRPGTGRRLLDDGYLTVGGTPEGLATKLQEGMKIAGEGIDEALEIATKTGVQIEKSTITSRLESLILSMADDPSQAPVIKKIQGYMEDIASVPGDAFGPKALEKAKRGYQALANYTDPEKSMAVKGVARILREEVESAIERASPEVKKKFLESKELWGFLAPVEEAASKRALQLQQSPLGGFLDVTSGVAGELGTGGAGIPLAIGRRVIAPRIASTAAIAADKAAKILDKVDLNSPFARLMGPLGVVALSKELVEDEANAELKMDTLTAIDKAQRKSDQLYDKTVKGIFSDKSELEPDDYPILKKTTQEQADDIEELTQETNSLLGDPEKLIDRMASASGVVGTYAPQVTAALDMITVRALNHLATELAPFQSDRLPLDRKPVPSKPQLLALARTMKYINNPSAALNEVQTGRISKEGQGVLNNVYMELYEDFKSRLMLGISEQQAKGKIIPNKKRLGLSMMLGQPLDSSMTPQSIAANQVAFRTPQRQPSEGRVSGASTISLSGRTMTQTEKIASR